MLPSAPSQITWWVCGFLETGRSTLPAPHPGQAPETAGCSEHMSRHVWGQGATSARWSLGARRTGTAEGAFIAAQVWENWPQPLGCTGCPLVWQGWAEAPPACPTLHAADPVRSEGAHPDTAAWESTPQQPRQAAFLTGQQGQGALSWELRPHPPLLLFQNLATLGLCGGSGLQPDSRTSAPLPLSGAPSPWCPLHPPLSCS